MQKEMQDHHQELEKIRQSLELDKAQLKHESLLRRSMKAVRMHAIR